MLALRAFLQKDLAPWLGLLRDPRSGEFIEKIGADPEAPKLLLVQARMAFSLAHLALLARGSGRDWLKSLAAPLVENLRHYRNVQGLYGKSRGEAPLAYDQSFVLLALATWQKLEPSAQNLAAMEALWQAMDQLRAPESGLFYEGAGPLSHNPQMHFYEALLQAYAMTGNRLWLERAAGLRRAALAVFYDAASGSMAEFKGQARREFGHQYEWAWLLLRERDFAPDQDLGPIAARLGAFATRFGHLQKGPLRGAVLDAGLPSGECLEQSCLLWPQTEAIKYFAVTGRAGEARALMDLIFKGWFGASRHWVNQLGPEGAILQPECFTRLFYHLVLAITEGARMGVWLEDFQA